MSKLLSLKVNLDKIDKSKLYKGTKGTYLDLDVWVNDEPDSYGNDASASLNLSKEEREAGAKKVYVGNGKKLFGWGSSSSATSEVDIESSALPF
ncbi:hypothetical protein [Brevundimonas sp.]|uniref:hypothetical protein n=1 Tax=Brevundimonas sp. TaxID=1871086 RepID=UPI00257E24B5|nr:hypothetical protein [Brevundimonas sp.]|tara:strand:- start:7213 stop:7494 length:282 start_codon:yes stop_codon:yes gene_type:complete